MSAHPLASLIVLLILELIHAYLGRAEQVSESEVQPGQAQHITTSVRDKHTRLPSPMFIPAAYRDMYLSMVIPAAYRDIQLS